MKKFLPKTINNPQGFTLIELLVVIAILAVLATIGFASFNGLTTRGNDDKRQVDIKAIADAYEVKRGTNVDYGTLALATTDFSAGIPPVNPSGQYCILTSTSAAVANAAIVTTPGNGILANGNCTGTWLQVSSTALASSTTFFKVCAMGTSSANIYCVGSKQ